MKPPISVPPTNYIALVRGINVGTAKRIAMAELRSLCEELGCADVRTYIQSGNLIFGSRKPAARLETDIERAIAGHFGVAASVIIRSAAEWPAYIEANPFREASAREPNLVMLALSKRVPLPEAEDALRERAAGGERIARVGDAVWIHYSRGVAKSRLFPGMLDRVIGSPVTTRNWRTVVKLSELAGDAEQ